MFFNETEWVFRFIAVFGTIFYIYFLLSCIRLFPISHIPAGRTSRYFTEHPGKITHIIKSAHERHSIHGNEAVFWLSYCAKKLLFGEYSFSSILHISSGLSAQSLEIQSFIIAFSPSQKKV